MPFRHHRTPPRPAPRTTQPPPAKPVTPIAIGGSIPTPYCGIPVGELLLFDDFLGTSLNSGLWLPEYPYGELNGVTTSPANVSVANSIVTLALPSSSSGACINTNPDEVTGFEFGHGIVEWLVKGPAANWWSVWQTGVSGLYPEFDWLETGSDTPGCNYHFWNGDTDEYTWNSPEFSAGYLDAWTYVCGRRNADGTFDTFYNQTQVVSAESAVDDTGINDYLIANVGVGNDNTTVTGAGGEVQIDHVAVWALP